MSTLDSWRPKILSLFRIIIGLLFLEHGTQKILHFPAPAPPPPVTAAAAAAKAAVASQGPTLAATLGGMSGWFELVGGLLIVFGLFTRATAFVLSGQMAFAYFLAHAPRGFYPIGNGGNGGELAIVYCFIFLYLVFSGPGPFSVDQLMKKKV